MNEKKVNRMLLYLIGFLCGHSAIVGMHPFMVPMLIAVYYMRQSTFGLFTAMLFGGAALYGGQGWNTEQIFRMGPYVMGMGENSAAYFLIKYRVKFQNNFRCLVILYLPTVRFPCFYGQKS